MADGETRATQHVLRLPELGLSQVPLVASLWLVPRGSEVTEGDRVLEVLAGDVTVDLAAPASGRLTAKLVEDDDPIVVGQALAIIEAPASGA
ncbi:MAG TPA: biotin/lipoyl-containing protein [Pirellulales bacterium]|jgi:pyruvate/2-oxoglutarate dehydrogenase complex dihydrolipoamide acyltransferase (E2) component|nr:biotin/lipoyl-containing protein [Pirellulales bacterium]